MKRILFVAWSIVVLTSCSSEESESKKKIELLPNIKNVSLNSKSSSQEVLLPKDIESEGAVVSLKDNAFWINHLSLKQNKITFDVIENIYTEQGHRFDTIEIKVDKIRIGTVCVTQARQSISPNNMVWAYSNAPLFDGELPEKLSGMEATKYIFNLEKTTKGKDNYKNYPVFAYCIEMNHDPENNMEWHLPTSFEMSGYRGYQILDKHEYWWTATDGSGRGYPFSTSHGTTPKSKSERYWVYAFRNGKI